MTKVEELEREVQELSRRQLADFREWFREYDADQGDRKIEADLRDGKLDKIAG